MRVMQQTPADCCAICGDSECYLIPHPSKPTEVCEMCFDALGDRAFANGYTEEVSL